MGVAATTKAIGLLYLRLERILDFSHLLFANFGLLLFALFCFRLVLLPQAARWPAMAIWYEVEWSLTDLAFWALVGRLLDVRQGKRLFALIGSGEMLSGIICGFSVPCLVARMGTVNLLWISMSGILCALILVYRLKQVYPEKFQAETRTDGAARLKNPLIWPLVARRLSDPAVRAVAFSVLDRGGAFTLTALFAEYDKEGQKPDVCYRILRLMGGIQKDECIEFLLDKLDVEDRTVSFEAIRSLQRLGYNAPEEMKQKIHGKIREEAGDAAWIQESGTPFKF